MAVFASVHTLRSAARRTEAHCGLAFPNTESLMNRYVLSSILLSGAIAACDEGAPESEFTGPGVAIEVAPLTLTNVANACYDIEVRNAQGTVWKKGDPARTRYGADQTIANGPTETRNLTADTDTVCSTQYGNLAGGDITYIGPCDASATADTNTASTTTVQNKVYLWVDGIYDSGTLDIGQWNDPCPAAGCELEVTCSENADTLVAYNFTIMRQANQGFFDIAVNFDDIFCSAKLDTCYADGPDAGTDPDPIALLHGADTVRDHTAVFGFACTAGADSTNPTVDIQTLLMYSNVAVTCSNGKTFNLNPDKAQDGNDVVSHTGSNLNYAIYRGAEQLNCGGTNSCNKLYWNLALSLDDLRAAGGAGTCSLTLNATANDNGAGFTNGVPSAQGVSYPYIDVNTVLTNNNVAACQQNPLNGTDPLNANRTSSVTTVYRGTLGGMTAPPVMCDRFNGTTASAVPGATGCDD